MKLTEIPILQTDRLVLRKLTANDIEDVFEYARVPEITKYAIWFPHQSKKDSLDFIDYTEKQFKEASDITWGIEIKAEQKIIGTIGLMKWNNGNSCGEIGYCISKDFWGKGIITEAMKAVIDYAFRILNLNRVEAHCEEENIGSWKVMLKAGMKFEGVLREKVYFKEKYHSMKVYSILKGEYESE